MTRSVRVFEMGSVFGDILMEKTPENIVYSDGSADLGIIMPEFNGAISGNFDVLLLPGNLRGSMTETGCAITYGMSPYDTITLSSVGTYRCVLAVQREIITVFGKHIEPQEMVVPRMHLAPDWAMAVWAALLLAGVELTEKIQ